MVVEFRNPFRVITDIMKPRLFLRLFTDSGMSEIRLPQGTGRARVGDGGKPGQGRNSHYLPRKLCTYTVTVDSLPTLLVHDGTLEAIAQALVQSAPFVILRPLKQVLFP